MEFKQLDIKPKGNWFKRTILTKHAKKTAIYIFLSAIAGFIFLYISEEKQFAEMTSVEIIKSMLMGGFLGFFITNSPCAGNKC